MKKILISIFLASTIVLSGCNTQSNSVGEAKVNISGEYTAYIKGDDWGAGVDKIVIELDSEIEGVSKDTFKIEEKKERFDWTKPELGLSEVKAERTIEDAYISDKNGNKVEGESKYVTVDMRFSPDEGSYLLLTMDSPYNQYPNLYDLEISVANGDSLKSKGKKIESFNVNAKMKDRVTTADEFKIGDYKAEDGIEYKYAHYEPKEKSDTLVVWLHGLCEGGVNNTDPYITALGNEVPTLIAEDFQKKMNNANVLVPQCPTFWMDNTGEGVMIENKIETDGTSHYTKSLYELINYYKEETGSKKVIIAGCSNGGYMAMLLALEYGDDFDSYVLICEAMEDKYISDEKIESIKDLPLYFIYSNDDPLVNPELHEIPTIKRLKEANASNLHVSTSDKVVDTTGRFTDADGNPHDFGGHSSWIYFFNNESKCDDCGIDAWSFMAK